MDIRPDAELISEDIEEGLLFLAGSTHPTSIEYAWGVVIKKEVGGYEIRIERKP